MKKITSFFLLFIFIFSMAVQPTFAATTKQIPGAPKGWRYRIDKGNSRGNENPHVHVYGPNGKEYVDGLGSSNSHKSKPKISEVPSKVRKKLEQQKDYKEAKKEAAEIRALKSKLKAKKLNFAKAADRAIAIGLVIAAGLSWFFPGDDAAAWTNLARAWGF